MPTYTRPARVGQGHMIFLEPWNKFPANLTVYQKKKKKGVCGVGAWVGVGGISTTWSISDSKLLKAALVSSNFANSLFSKL